MAMSNYRFLRNGNGMWMIQKKGWLWGWNDVQKYRGSYAGGWSYTPLFDSKENACSFLQEILNKQRQEQLAEKWEVVDIKCSSTLTSKEPNG